MFTACLTCPHHPAAARSRLARDAPAPLAVSHSLAASVCASRQQARTRSPEAARWLLCADAGAEHAERREDGGVHGGGCPDPLWPADAAAHAEADA
eukprot:6079980-Pleurochrysis_carterae.AAC.2